LPRDQRPPLRVEESLPRYQAKPGSTPDRAFGLLRQGATLDDVARQMHVTADTAVKYLTDFILREQPENISRWVPDEVYQQVAQAARQVGTERLKPIFLALGEKVPYDQIRLVVTHLTARTGAG
jgi:uncharacterized protein YpbB